MEGPGVEEIDEGEVGVVGTEPDFVSCVVPDEVLIPGFEVVDGIDGASVVVAVEDGGYA